MNSEMPENDNLENENIERKKQEQEIRRRMIERRRLAEKRRVRRNRIFALAVLIIIILIVVKCCSAMKSTDKENIDTDSSVQTNSVAEADVKNKNDDSKSESQITESKEEEPEHKIEEKNGMTFVDGILIVNKTYSLPADYDPGTSAVAQNAFDKMAAAAAKDGITLFINSGYRSYQEQVNLYNSYAYERGTEEADKVSSRPGHSEHQTGLTFDVNTTELSFEGTPEAIWLEKHCAEYGFIIRYPKGKEDETGYIYEPWHIRYLGKETAEKVTESGLTLEKYLGITSDYKYAKDKGCISQ